MQKINSFRIYTSIMLFAILALPCISQTISETAGTTTTINVLGGELFADPNDGTTGGIGGDCSTTGSGNLGDYPNCDCITVTTLTAPPGLEVIVTFSEFRVFGNFDWLVIFDGNAPVNANNGSGSINNPTSTDPVLWNSSVNGDELTDMINAGSVTFISTSGSLTFASRFSGVVNTCGWEADVSICTGNNDCAFVTTWDINAMDTVTIPLQSGTYNFNYSWEEIGDSTNVISGVHMNADGDFTTEFTQAGTYRLFISGQFPHMRDYPKDKLLDVLQWGDIQWSSMESMFSFWPGASFSAVDAPDLSQVTSLKEMFNGAFNFNENISHWDVSNITNMDGVFRDAISFNQPIGIWDVSNVQNMNALFLGADVFNQDISNWVVSSVTNMNSVFFGANNFNQPLDTWDVSQADRMINMFRDATAFNQDISSWDVSNVMLMENMFQSAVAFDQAIGSWDVSQVVSFRRMFLGATQFNQSLGSWKFKPNAAINFSAFSSGVNNMSCENYSATLLGWNFNNPDIVNLSLQGFNADFDAAVSIARDELIARGWNMNLGTDIGGDCGGTYEFTCQDTLNLKQDTLFGNLIISAVDQINLDSLTFVAPANIFISAPEVNMEKDILSELSVEIEILQNGCTPN